MSSRIDYTKYNQIVVDGICNIYRKNHDINGILELFPGFHYNEVVSILVAHGWLHNIELCQFSLTDKKVMFISDTHYGSVYDNINYAYYAFDFAKANGIKTIFHGGDVLEGNAKPREGFTSEKQAEYFIKNYPYDKDIITRTILGNHDLTAVILENKVSEILKARDDIEILGFKKIFFDWESVTVGLQHEIKKYRLCYPRYSQEDIGFKGHSHFYHTKYCYTREDVYIPALSDDPTPYQTARINDEEAKKPGFLVVENYGGYVIVNHYFFDNNNHIIKGNEHSLVKKFKKTRD